MVGHYLLPLLLLQLMVVVRLLLLRRRLRRLLLLQHGVELHDSARHEDSPAAGHDALHKLHTRGHATWPHRTH